MKTMFPQAQTQQDSSVAEYVQRLAPTALVDKYFSGPEVSGAVAALGRSLTELPYEVIGKGVQAIKADLLATAVELDIRIKGLEQEASEVLAQLATHPESPYPSTWQARPSLVSLVAMFNSWRQK